MSPTPIADSLNKILDQTSTKIPQGSKGFAQVQVATTGVEAEVGQKWKNLTVSGYAGKLWGGGGWQAGARAKVIW